MLGFFKYSDQSNSKVVSSFLADIKTSPCTCRNFPLTADVSQTLEFGVRGRIDTRK